MALAGAVLGAAPAAGGNAGVGDCQVRRMAVPDDIGDGRVMDIEVVPGLGTVYYGSYERPDAERGWAQRAVVWYGADAQPVQMGPPGTLHDIGFELTPTGLINGQSVVDDSGRERAWVQDLRSGRVTWIDTGEDTAGGIYIRRINDRGEAAGTVYFEGFSAEARTWLRPGHGPGRALERGELGFAEGWDITNHRRVVGSVAEDVGDGWLVPKGVIWGRDGAIEHVLASNPAVGYDTYPRLLSEAGQAAGVAWYGDLFEGHYEAAAWPAPGAIESLGLLPGGGESAAYGQSEGGWVVGMADHFDPDSPGAEPWGGVNHSILWTGEADAIRVLPSPWAVANEVTDWHEWYGGAAHGAHTGLDQVGSMAHGGWHDDGVPQLVPTLYVNASQCGELVPTTHTAFWEESHDEAVTTTATTAEPAEARRGATSVTSARPAAYGHKAVRERLTQTP